jgi:hypothetical protein
MLAQDKMCQAKKNSVEKRGIAGDVTASYALKAYKQTGGAVYEPSEKPIPRRTFGTITITAVHWLKKRGKRFAGDVATLRRQKPIDPLFNLIILCSEANNM